MATHTTKKRPAEETHAGYAELRGKRRAVPAKGRRTLLRSVTPSSSLGLPAILRASPAWASRRQSSSSSSTASLLLCACHWTTWVTTWMPPPRDPCRSSWRPRLRPRRTARDTAHFRLLVRSRLPAWQARSPRVAVGEPEPAATQVPRGQQPWQRSTCTCAHQAVSFILLVNQYETAFSQQRSQELEDDRPFPQLLRSAATRRNKITSTPAACTTPAGSAPAVRLRESSENVFTLSGALLA